jgi:spore coat polysaccharide biosynthesis protein SpsF
MKTGAVIQARVSSTRLPGKVMLRLPGRSGKTVLEHVVSRVAAAKGVDEVVVATSFNSEDDAIERLFRGGGIKVFRGSLHNVLERYYLAAKESRFNHVVRITADCPLTDPEIVSLCVKQHHETNADFTTAGAIERTFPIGIDIAIMTFGALEKAYREAALNHEKEHVTSFFYKSHPEKFKIESVTAPPGFREPSLRLTLDTPADYAFINLIYNYLYDDNHLFGLERVFRLLKHEPWMKEINTHIVQKKIYSSESEEIRRLITLCEQHGLERAKQFLSKFQGGS